MTGATHLETPPYLVGTVLGALGDMGRHIAAPHATDVPVSDEARRGLDTAQRTLRRWWTL